MQDSFEIEAKKQLEFVNYIDLMDNQQQLNESQENQLFESNLQISNSNSPSNAAYCSYTRSDNDVRKNYIQKLLQNNVLKKDLKQKHQSIIIFDWDDTILCTSQLEQYNFVNISYKLQQQLKKLDSSATQLLKKALSFGTTYIITNGVKEWVENSSFIYLPEVSKLISENQIRVISARDKYKDIFPVDQNKWKIEAFKSLKKFYDKDLLFNLICIGDSYFEIQAGQLLAKEFPQSLIKTIKFKEGPNIQELRNQIDLIYQKFEQIYLNMKNLTIRLEKKCNL